MPKSVPVVEDPVPEEAVVLAEESEGEVVFHPPEAVEVAAAAVEVEEEEEPVAEVVDEAQEVSQLVVESNTKIEEVPKKSYASIVMDLKQSDVPFSSPPPSAPRKPQPRIQEHQVNNAQPIASVTESAASNVDAVENGIHEEEGMLTFFLKSCSCFYLLTLCLKVCCSLNKFSHITPFLELKVLTIFICSNIYGISVIPLLQ